MHKSDSIRAHSSRASPPRISVPQLDGIDRSDMPVTAHAADYLPSEETGRHSHPHIQLIHAVRGVMVVGTEQGQWIVPPTRGLLMPPGMAHWIRMVGEVRMRTAFIRPDCVPTLQQECRVVRVSPLLREMIIAAIDMPLPYAMDSRQARLAAALLDEVMLMPSLPLSLPNPRDPRLQTICKTIVDSPEEASTLQDWARRLSADPKTIHRLFVRETGMSFGQWRQQARLLTALEKLAAGTRVLDVALHLGYNSPTAFSTMFKRQFGVSPSSFFA